MLEIKVTIEATEIANAIHNLAAAMAAKGVVTPPAPATAIQQVTPAPATPPLAPVPPVQASPAPAPTPTAVPVAGVPVAPAPTYTVEQIMAAGATLMDAGKANELVSLLHSFGVQAVMDLKPEQLGMFATKMRELGAKI